MVQDSCTINSKASQISWTVQLKTMRNHQKASETTHHHPSKVDIKTARFVTHTTNPQSPTGTPTTPGRWTAPGVAPVVAAQLFLSNDPLFGSTSLHDPPYGPTWHDELRIAKANTVTMPVSEALKMMLRLVMPQNADVSGDLLTLAPRVFLLHWKKLGCGLIHH